MLKRKSIILGILVIIFTFGIAIVFAGMKKAPKEREIVTKKIIVPVKKIETENISLRLPVVGNLEAQAKVAVYAEVSGILEPSEKSFLEGVRFSKGEALLSIEDNKYRAEVYANRSSFMNAIASVMPDMKFDYPESYAAWEKYLNAFDIEKALAPIPEPIDEKEKYYLAGKNIYTNYYNIKSQEEQLSKYTIAAPFSGEVIESNIKPGTLIMSGQKLGEFVNTNAYDLVVGIDLNNLNGIQVGNQVNVYSNSIDGSWPGTVRRISKKMDEKTQMVNVYISVSGDELKEGMFLNADIELSKAANGVEIPRKLLVNSEYVYIINDGVAKLKKVSIIQKKDNSVVIEGIADGALLALKTSGIHEGIQVKTIMNDN